MLVEDVAHGIQQRVAARIVDDERLARLQHLADFRIGREIDAQLADHGVVARGYHPAGTALRIDEDERAPFHRQPACKLFHHFEEQAVDVAARRERPRHVEQRGEVLRLPEHLVAVAARTRKRAEQRRKIRGGVRGAHESVELIGGARLLSFRQDADERSVALARERD